MSKQRLTVQGLGHVSAPPDQVEIQFTITRKHKEYQKCVADLDESTEQLYQVLETAGITASQIKLSSYSTNTVYKNDENRSQTIFDGYSAYCKMQLDLNFEQELLAGVFDAIAKIAGFIKVDVKFTIRDISKFEDQALEQAIAIAKSKSELIAQSTGLTLGKIRDIVYGQVQWFGERKIMSTETESRDRPVFLRARPVEVADVEINDDVTISWEVSG